MTTYYHVALRVILSCFIFSVALVASAELVVSGRVLETGTRKPLEGMTVFLLEREANAVVTRKDGGFTLSVDAPGDYSLVGLGLGYKKSLPMRFSIGAQEEAEEVVLLLEPVYSMMEVVVHADRDQDKTAKTVVSGKELVTVPGSMGDPLRGMQALPGVTSRSDVGTSIFIRGAGPGDIYYYMDFLPVGYLDHMGGVSSVFNAGLVADVGMYSSSFGPAYADVIGAVVDVRLREPRKDKISGTLNVSFLEADALIEGPAAPNQSFYLGARRSYFDLLIDNPPEKDGIRVTQLPKYYDYQGKYLWKLSEEHTLTLQMSGANDQVKSTLTSESIAVKHDPVLEGDYSLYKLYNTVGALLDSKISPGVNNRLGVSYIDTFTENHMGQVGYAKVDSGNVFFRDHLNISAGEHHDLLFGVDYTLYDMYLDLNLLDSIPSEWDPGTHYPSASRVIMNDRFTVHSWGLALKDRWKISEPLTLVIGQRTAYESYFDTYKIEPRLFAEYTPVKQTLITAGWGKYHEFPQQYQVIEKLGNPKLSYMQADHYVLGAEQRLFDGWSVKVEEYYKQLYHLVVPDETLNYVNAGSGRSYGTEVMIKKNRTSDWWGWVSAAYSRSERHNELTGETFSSPYDQPYILNLNYNYKVSPKWTFGARWRFQSGGRFTPVVGTYKDTSDRIRPVYGELWSERLPVYHRLDLRMSAEMWSGMQKVEFYIDIVNVYNQRNVSGYEYNVDYTSRNPTEDWPFLPNIGFQTNF